MKTKFFLATAALAFGFIALSSPLVATSVLAAGPACCCTGEKHKECTGQDGNGTSTYKKVNIFVSGDNTQTSCAQVTDSQKKKKVASGGCMGNNLWKGDVVSCTDAPRFPSGTLKSCPTPTVYDGSSVSILDNLISENRF